MKKRLYVLLGLAFVSPVFVLAQGIQSCNNQIGIETVICKISSILNTLIPVIVVLGVVYFIWGVVQYVIADDEEAKKTGRMRMIYGIIGLVVIVGMWGLVRLVTTSFSLDNGQQGITIPRVPVQ